MKVLSKIKKIYYYFFRKFYFNKKRFEPGFFKLGGKRLKYIDAASYSFIYEEIFHKEIYKFKCINETPYILDAGSNIGLSIIYFKLLYPNASIVGFEPDSHVFDILDFNIKSFAFDDVHLVKKALWEKETEIDFYSEGADGGRLATLDDDKVVKVKTDLLSRYIDRRVDFLKIDIEGAELKVLRECQPLLYLVDRIFVEYHSFSNEPQFLQEILSILAQEGFRYNVQNIGVFSSNPFLKIDEYAGMDNQLNIFCIK